VIKAIFPYRYGNIIVQDFADADVVAVTVKFCPNFASKMAATAADPDEPEKCTKWWLTNKDTFAEVSYIVTI
jgi:hypothetical protein